MNEHVESACINTDSPCNVSVLAGELVADETQIPNKKRIRRNKYELDHLRRESKKLEDELAQLLQIQAHRPSPKTLDVAKEGVGPLGKRVIGSVGGVEALSWGFIENITAELLIESGAVACLVGSLNGASGSALDIEEVIYLPVTLGSVERRIPFAVVRMLHVDAILGTNALKDVRAVVDLDESTVTLKDTGEVFPLGSPRVEESYLSRISSTIRLRPGGQARAIAEIQGQLVDGATVLVEGLAELDDSIKVARTLCTVYDDQVIMEVCNPSIEDAVVKRSTRLASVTVIPETALPRGTTASLKHEAARPGEAQTMDRKPQDHWVHSVISVSSEVAKESVPGLDRVPKEMLRVDLDESKLGSEQKRIFTKFLQPFKEMFVETSMCPGRTSLLEFSIDTGEHPPIKQPPYRVSKAEGDVMKSEIQEYLTYNPLQALGRAQSG
ncbi:hypothetical protein PInf_022181 [Phytophthora infestans]|nr:hypothetical protein PInf_022181 [Phytophthora infestans]